MSENSSTEMNQAPDLEDALNGLRSAEQYCDSRGFDETTREIARLYQRLGRIAPDEDWDSEVDHAE